ncbi:VTC domain-containing protein [Clostridium perfringens]|uniref:polyphosphate polymerase domain-containing protein n=1 Tax=Clostridium perfringens TaxID=1502 RepID=UPI000D710672|nr:polyphosphate polymerase domain-containing protein [Clostridium perfringens]PWX72365.1 VTC domain-containing protein [Clostridium perfringens]
MIVNRRELKYVISEFDYYKLENLLKKILIPDKNNGSYGYSIRSLYFDSIDNCDYYAKLGGEEVRKKIRLRIYRTDCHLSISREDAIALINKEYDVLLKYNSPIAEAAYNIMTIGQYQPVVLVEYNRRAYIHEENSIRVTLDSNIRASETDFDLFSEEVFLTPVFTHYDGLLEVKYDGDFFCWISQIVNGREAVNQSMSKYCASRRFFENYLA